jgi:hypothetical protein
LYVSGWWVGLVVWDERKLVGAPWNLIIYRLYRLGDMGVPLLIIRIPDRGLEFWCRTAVVMGATRKEVWRHCGPRKEQIMRR